MTLRVGITGIDGQFGFHLRAWLQYHCGHEVVGAGRRTFGSPEDLDDFVRGCDAIFHLAGVNRGTDEEVADGNRGLAAALAIAVERAGTSPHLVYASSIQRLNDSVYGRAKAAAADILAEVSRKAGAPFAELVLPNLFGEFTRPNYNSFVGTFCHRVAAGDEPTIHADNPVELLHYLGAAEIVAEAISERKAGQIAVSGTNTSVGTVSAKLKSFRETYAAGVIPDFRDAFDLQLFNTYRSVLYPSIYPVALEPRSDNRGSLVECVRTLNGGQAFYSSTHPGITRGNHFHFGKVERFIVLAGEARISIRKIYSDEVQDFDVSGDRPCFIDMPTFHSHNITNTGSGELLTLFWAHEFFDQARPDTYAEPVR